MVVGGYTVVVDWRDLIGHLRLLRAGSGQRPISLLNLGTDLVDGFIVCCCCCC